MEKSSPSIYRDVHGYAQLFKWGHFNIEAQLLNFTTHKIIKSCPTFSLELRRLKKNYLASNFRTCVLSYKSLIVSRKQRFWIRTTDIQKDLFFSKIQKFWAWADKLGWNFGLHFGYFQPNYWHYFSTVSPLFMHGKV